MTYDMTGGLVVKVAVRWRCERRWGLCYGYKGRYKAEYVKGSGALLESSSEGASCLCLLACQRRDFRSRWPSQFTTTSQLDRSDFQSITGSHEGAFRHVLIGAEMSSGRTKSAFVFDFPFAFGHLVGGNGWFSA